MAPVLWVIAVLSNITVVHRILYTYQQTRERDEETLRREAHTPVFTSHA
jgi:CDP-diacylglycerol--glycerol-3-phosphate 3-phosphatidyltransferase